MSSYGLPTRLGHSQRQAGVPWACRLCRGVCGGGVQAGGQGPGCPCWGGDPPWCAQMTPDPSVPPRSPGSSRPRVPRPRRAPPLRATGSGDVSGARQRSSGQRRPRARRAGSHPAAEAPRTRVSGPRAPPRGQRARCSRSPGWAARLRSPGPRGPTLLN